MKVLIVDDYPTNLKLLRASLEDCGHGVVEATNGVEALSALTRENVDAVISDVLMPAMDGFRLCTEIRKSEHYHAMPVILYTSTYNSATDRELSVAVGADAYILKPAPIAEILEAIRIARIREMPLKESGALIGTAEVLERYNGVLIRKLESRNEELQRALKELQTAHGVIVDLNRTLEARVAERTAALDDANRELEAFSYSVSHDLRAPIRHISGFAELLEEDCGAGLNDENRRMLNQIKTAATHMSDLVDALLDFARTGRAELGLQDLELEPLLGEALETVQRETEGREIEWRRHHLPRVRGDKTLLRQVFINLLSNAVKYSRGRKPAIIEIGEQPGGATEAVIFVKDNGVGFDSKYAKELFGVFKRLHHSREFEGIGIGLANAHRIVTRHGGRIWAEAALNLGATFYFSLQRA
jgi:signal transduction histidine kinase